MYTFRIKYNFQLVIVRDGARDAGYTNQIRLKDTPSFFSEIDESFIFQLISYILSHTHTRTHQGASN